VANRGKHREELKAQARRAAGYRPARKPKLVGAALGPPPLPTDAGHSGRFGAAAEEGLSALAAVETMPSLEPDYGDDLALEASVTIIERAEPAAPDPAALERGPQRSLKSRLDDMAEAPDLDANEHAAYRGLVEEAVVEIVELPDAAPAAPPRRRARRLSAALRDATASKDRR